MNQRTNTEWNSYLATGIAEGFERSDGIEQEIEAWAYLIMTGLAWQLQGWFGRNAHSLIQNGVVDRDGTIDWDTVDYMIEEAM